MQTVNDLDFVFFVTQRTIVGLRKLLKREALTDRLHKRNSKILFSRKFIWFRISAYLDLLKLPKESVFHRHKPKSEPHHCTVRHAVVCREEEGRTALEEEINKVVVYNLDVYVDHHTWSKVHSISSSGQLCSCKNSFLFNFICIARIPNNSRLDWLCNGN